MLEILVSVSELPPTPDGAAVLSFGPRRSRYEYYRLWWCNTQCRWYLCLVSYLYYSTFTSTSTTPYSGITATRAYWKTNSSPNYCNIVRSHCPPMYHLLNTLSTSSWLSYLLYYLLYITRVTCTLIIKDLNILNHSSACHRPELPTAALALSAPPAQTYMHNNNDHSSLVKLSSLPYSSLCEYRLFFLQSLWKHLIFWVHSSCSMQKSSVFKRDFDTWFIVDSFIQIRVFISFKIQKFHNSPYTYDYCWSINSPHVSCNYLDFLKDATWFILVQKR